jgi:hypothetical protein
MALPGYGAHALVGHGQGLIDSQYRPVGEAAMAGMTASALLAASAGARGVEELEYLRIIYGPDYLMAEHLERLRIRSVGAKRGLALREFALGIEGLQRFTAGEPLRRAMNASSRSLPWRASRSTPGFDSAVPKRAPRSSIQGTYLWLGIFAIPSLKSLL